MDLETLTVEKGLEIPEQEEVGVSSGKHQTCKEAERKVMTFLGALHAEQKVRQLLFLSLGFQDPRFFR